MLNRTCTPVFHICQVLGLRMVDGVSHGRWEDRSDGVTLVDTFGNCPHTTRARELGLLVLDDQGLRATATGLPLLDSLLPGLLLTLEMRGHVLSPSGHAVAVP